MSAAPAQMLTEWLVGQQKVAGQHLQSVKTCITLLEHTTRLAGVAEGDIRGRRRSRRRFPRISSESACWGPCACRARRPLGLPPAVLQRMEEHALGHFMRAERTGVSCERPRVSRGRPLASPPRQALTQTYVTVSKRSEGALAIGGHRRSEQDPGLPRGGLR